MWTSKVRVTIYSSFRPILHVPQGTKSAKIVYLYLDVLKLVCLPDFILTNLNIAFFSLLMIES